MQTKSTPCNFRLDNNTLDDLLEILNFYNDNYPFHYSKTDIVKMCIQEQAKLVRRLKEEI